MKFINFAKYSDLDRIARARTAHFAHADRPREQGELAIRGPLLDDQRWRIRLLFVYDAVSRDAALALAQEDPFTLANALSGYEIREWHLRSVNLDLLVKANRSADRSGGKNTQNPFVRELREIWHRQIETGECSPGALELRSDTRKQGQLTLAGRFANDEGGLFVYNAAGREEAMSYLEQDSFALEGVFADYELLEWLIEGVKPDLLTSDFPSAKSERAVPNRELPTP